MISSGLLGAAESENLCTPLTRFSLYKAQTLQHIAAVPDVILLPRLRILNWVHVTPEN